MVVIQQAEAAEQLNLTGCDPVAFPNDILALLIYDRFYRFHSFLTGFFGRCLVDDHIRFDTGAQYCGNDVLHQRYVQLVSDNLLNGHDGLGNLSLANGGIQGIFHRDGHRRNHFLEGGGIHAHQRCQLVPVQIQRVDKGQRVGNFFF